MALIGRDYAARGMLKGGGVVATVMSNLGLERFLDGIGLSLVRTKVGDRHVLAAMRAGGYNVGGEQSGHVIISDYHNTGDGMLTGIHLMLVMKKTGKSLTELLADFKEYPQVLVNVPVKDKNSWKNHQAVVDAIDSVEKHMAGDGRVLVRPSGTQELLRVMAEGPTQEITQEYVDRIVKVVTTEMGE